jgi:hypothetical protein
METGPLLHQPPCRTGQAGQALIETALVMPLFVFVLLGTFQLGLMHQAHAMTKYAAYKAVRAGALYHAKREVMERAAEAVLLPMISWQDRGIEHVMPVTDATSYVQKVQRVRAAAVFPNAQVKICGPTRNNARVTNGINAAAQRAGNEVQFDAPIDVGSLDWKASERTKLRVEVTFNYRLPIPFANMLIYRIARGQERADLLWVTRLGRDPTQLRAREQRDLYDSLADSKQGYVLPIRASYAMRMMSDLYPDKNGFELPARNDCTLPFAKGGGE